MTPNNNLSILPFYTDIQKQNHRKDYAFGEVFPLFTPDRKILPFQIIRNHVGGAGQIWANLFSYSTGIAVDITSQIRATGIVVKYYPSIGVDVIEYPGTLLLTTDTPEGRYHVSLSDGANHWVSEVFTIVRSVNGYLKIEYSNSESLIFENGKGVVSFDNDFSFIVYLPTQLGRPEYEFEEQVEKRDGFQFVEKQISEKTFKFNFLAPEYLLDAMRMIRMMDAVTITCQGETYNVDQFLITPKWRDGGYLASVDAEFQCGTVIKKLGNTYNSGFVMGDFNNDFSNDFYKL